MSTGCQEMTSFCSRSTRLVCDITIPFCPFRIGVCRSRRSVRRGTRTTTTTTSLWHSYSFDVATTKPCCAFVVQSKYSERHPNLKMAPRETTPLLSSADENKRRKTKDEFSWKSSWVRRKTQEGPLTSQLCCWSYLFISFRLLLCFFFLILGDVECCFRMHGSGRLWWSSGYSAVSL
jgi:hypothetical protein